MTAPTRKRAAVLLACGALTAAVLSGCGTDDGSADDPAAADSSTSTPGDEPTDRPEDSSSAPTKTESTGSDTVAAPVYFVGDTPQGPRLYREFRQVGADDPLRGAAGLMASGDALDPDYRTLWTSGEFGDIGLDEEDDYISLFLPQDGTWAERGDLTKAQARLAVQQAVYTLQGVTQTRDPLRVFDADGEPTTLFGVDTGAGVKNAPQLKVLALASVTGPEQGATVSGSFTASGVASSFEATVPWQVRQGDTVVKKGFSTAKGWIDKLYPWTTEVDVSDLDPGEYTFVAMTDDPSGGEGGGPTEDSKTITVE